MEQQYHQLSGKTVLVLGSGGFSHQPVFEALFRLNVKIVLVDMDDEYYVTDYVYHAVKYQTFVGSSYRDDVIHLSNILELLGDKVKQISGCFTFYDEYLYLTALFCQKLGFIGITPKVVETVMSKQDTSDILKSDCDTAGYSPLSFRINGVQDIMRVKDIAFPAVLKPEYGTWSTGVTEVFSHADCLEKYQRLKQESVTNEILFGTRYGCSMVLMEFLPGNSYQVEVIIFNGELLKGIPSTMGPKLMHCSSFLDTTTCSTSCLAKNLENDLIIAAFNICKKIGLQNGVFNVELKFTESGFKLIEVNGRPGSYLRCAVFKDTNSIDIFVINALISCGIKPVVPDIPQRYAVGCYLYPSIHGKALTSTWNLDKIKTLLETNELLYLKASEKMTNKKEQYQKCFSHIVALGDSTNTAKRKFIKICKDLELLSNDDFNIEKLTECFN